MEAWDIALGTAAVGANHYADIDLHVVNTRPTSQIHQIRYSDESPVLTSANPCQEVTLNLADADPGDDSLRFLITADHPTGFFHSYSLSGWYGHNTPINGSSAVMHSSTTPAVNLSLPTPGTISYQSCAYRFRLSTVPRITNGYHRIYRRDDNWYACIKVMLPP